MSPIEVEMSSARPVGIDSQQFANVLTVVVLFLFCSKEPIESFCIIDGIFQLSMELFREIQIFWCLIYWGEEAEIASTTEILN